MNIERVQVGGKAVLYVAGRMNAENAARFESACESCISEGFKSLVVDLGDLVYISSGGIRSIVVIAKKLKDKGGELRICRLTGMVLQVFEITKLTQVFPLHDSVESAIQ
jgi:stage II sporulation protein AA (anti-sigma F factor antagonist)